MPRTSSSRESLFPELTSKLSTDELVKRLKVDMYIHVQCMYTTCIVLDNARLCINGMYMYIKSFH